MLQKLFNIVPLSSTNNINIIGNPLGVGGRGPKPKGFFFFTPCHVSTLHKSFRIEPIKVLANLLKSRVQGRVLCFKCKVWIYLFPFTASVNVPDSVMQIFGSNRVNLFGVGVDSFLLPSFQKPSNRLQYV